MPVDINRLTEGWLELESDPGLFTLLLENFGVQGVQVEEIYDLQKTFEGPVNGFIFLFRWIEERRSRRNIVLKSESFVKDEDVVNNIFFAQQMVPNSCATHALLSVLLNCPSLHLGSTLSRLKAHTSGMSPENKGWAIGNTPELAKAHNSHAMPQAKRRLDKSTGVTTGRCLGEAFHFVSYVPIRGRLFELDGLKPFPIDHGPWGDKEDWTEKFRRVITERLGIATGEQYHDIRFNLMAVVPDKRLALTHKLQMLKTNRQIVLEALQQLVRAVPSPKVKRSKASFGEKKCISLASSTDGPKHHEMEPPSPSSVTVKSDNKVFKAAAALADAGISLPTDTILEAHNYARIPAVLKTSDTIKTVSVSSKQDGLFPPDYSTPLMIQTSPAPSSSSTDTSSEVGSAFNSPTHGWGWNSGQNSPTCTKDFKKFVVIRVFGPGEERPESMIGLAAGRVGKRLTEGSSANSKKVCLDAVCNGRATVWNGESEEQSCTVSRDQTDSNHVSIVEENNKLFSKYPELFEPHTFAPKDLLALLKNLESEITVCEVNLRDENEKRKKYKVDDCRRTHNYDEFICTFLSMLAQQGHLADLVEQHLLLHKKPGLPIARIKGLAGKKQDPRSTSNRRRRGRTKNRKRK